MSAQGHHGYGLRVPHYRELLEHGPGVGLVEVVSENFVARGGRPKALLERVRKDSDVALHGVSLSIGGTDPLNERYLDELAALSREIGACWVSDHLCYGTHGGHYAHDLWPLPRTEEAVAHVAERVRRAQDRLGRQILLENISTYLELRHDALTEAEFLAAVVERADALILLDVNNAIVNSKNLGGSPVEFLEGLPKARVRQLHLAGHTDHGTHAIDDHGSAVPDDVWQLYREVVRRFGPVPAIVEWDENVPTLRELEEQARLAETVEREILRDTRAA
jgi:uncharacterized protein (UPF0276 family)